MKIYLIAALARNRVIGLHGRTPWHLPEDLKRFKQLTVGHAVLMGRTTFESIGAPLADRRNVVLTHRPLNEVECYAELPRALTALAKVDLLFVIGGGKVFEQTILIAHGMYLTFVEGEFEGDTYFPEYEHLIGKRFTETRREVKEGFECVDYGLL